MRKLLFLLLPALAMAQTFTSVTWTSSTPTTIEATYLATGPITPYAKFGTVTPSTIYNPNITAPGTDGALINNVALNRYDIRGLLPGTTYQVQLCFNPGAEVCSTQTAVTTMAEQRVPTLPALPTVRTTPPTPTAVPPSLAVTGSCLDPSTGLQARLNAVTCGQEVVIPASITDCAGGFTLTAKACTGGPSGTYVTIRGNAADIDQPPPGTRVHQTTVDLAARTVTLDTSREAAMPVWYSAGLDVAFGDPAVNSNCAATVAGEYRGFFNTGNVWDRLKRCVLGTSVTLSGFTSSPLVLTTAAPHGIGAGEGFCVSGATGVDANDCYTASSVTSTTITLSGVTWTGTLGGSPVVRRLSYQLITPTAFPSTRPSGACSPLAGWGHYTGAGADPDWRNNAYLCTADGWVKVTLISGGLPGLTITGNSRGVYITGIQFRSVAHPRDEHLTAKAAQLPPFGTLQAWNIIADPGTSDIVLDRVYVNGNSASGARSSGVLLNGTNSAIINSSLINLSSWQTNNAVDPTRNSFRNPNVTSGAFFASCGNNLLFRNNVVEAYGIMVHLDDGCPNSFTAMENVTIAKNTFFMRDSYRVTSPSNNGWDHALRQVNEFKNGNTVLIEANDYIGGWTSATPSATAITTSAINTIETALSANCVSGVCTWVNPNRFNITTYPVGRVLGIATSGNAAPSTALCTVTASTATTVTCSPAPANGVWHFRQGLKRGNQDFTIRNNRHSGLPSFFQGFGNLYWSQLYPVPSGRWYVGNNLAYRLDAQLNAGPMATGAASSFFASANLGSWYAHYENNTAYIAIPDGVASTQAFFLLNNGTAFPAMQSTRPIMSGNIFPYTGAGIRRTATDNGIAAMNAEYGAGNWTWGSHLWMGSTTVAGFPAGDYWTASTPVQADGSLPRTSIYAAAGASRDVSGVGMGANLQTIADAQGVIETAVSVATAGGIEIRWLSSDSPCVAEYRTGGAGPYTRASPTVTGRRQVVSVTGTGSYDWRVICPSAQRSGAIVR
ncbi:MAG: hypothetical protein ACK5NY_01510 [Burkholderiaceae bacterium]|jgi:hypothetical protein